MELGMQTFCSGLMASMDEPPTISEIMHKVGFHKGFILLFESTLVSGGFTQSIR